MSTTPDLAGALQQAAAKLQHVWPDPTELNDRQKRVADLAIDGTYVHVYNGEHLIKLGRRDIDWHGLDANGKERLSMVRRMPAISALAHAYHVTRENEYAAAAADYIREWMKGFPVDESGTHPKATSTLDLCIRNRGWAQALHLVVDSPAFDQAFLERILAYVSEQFRYLKENMSTTINWRVHNARDLLIGALFLDFLPPASEWRRYAIAALNDAWHRQFLPDGVHYERNPIYHMGMTSTFTTLYELGRAMPELGVHVDFDHLIKAYDFMLACTKPNGYTCAIHDSQSESTGHLRDGRHTEGHKGVDLRRSWENFREKFDIGLKLPSTSQYFPDAGLGFFRTGWGEDDAWVSFDATQWGGGHCHLSRNAVQFHANRRTLVVDPGWLEYSSNEWGVHGRTTRAHNTCNLNGYSQVQTNPTDTRHYAARGYEAMHSKYEGGYWDTALKWNFSHAGDGHWAEHARTMLWVQDRFLFVVDSMFRLPRSTDEAPEDAPSFELNWQLSEDAKLTLADDASRAAAHFGESNLLLLFPIRPDGAQLASHTGETGPLRGWLPGEHQHRPASQLCLNTPRMTNQHEYYVSVLVPYTTDEPPAVDVEAKSPRGTVGFVKLRWADGSADEIHWGCGFNIMIGQADDIETDSSLVHLRRTPEGRIARGCVVNGTYLRPIDENVRARPATWAF